MTGVNPDGSETGPDEVAPETTEVGPEDVIGAVADPSGEPLGSAGGSDSDGSWFDDLAANAPSDDTSTTHGESSVDDGGLGGVAGVQDIGLLGPEGSPTQEISLVDLEEISRLTAERDQYLEASRRLQADMENYRKQVARREVESRERANERLVSEMLPVLDACDAALASGATDVEPVNKALVDVLSKQGLERIDQAGEEFDPNAHEAVMHEPADDAGESAGPVVAEVLRAGYRWKGRVLRPAMVKVRG